MTDCPPVGATTGCKCPYRGTFGHFSSCPTQARPPVGATAAKVFKQGDRVRILPSVCDVNPHNADLVGQEHVVWQATWHGGDADPYQDVHIVINGVEITFHPSSLEPVGATPEPEDVAQMLYNANEWSGCNGSRWEVMPGHLQRERIRAARDVLDALTANGYAVVFVGDESPEDDERTHIGPWT